MYGCELLLEFFGFLFVGVVDFSLLHWNDILIVRRDDSISHTRHRWDGFADLGEYRSIRDADSEIEGHEPEDDECYQSTRSSHESVHHGIDVKITYCRLSVPSHERSCREPKQYNTDESRC